MMKRTLDLLVSIAVIPVAVPICVVMALLYFIVERENPLYTQIRVGYQSQPFRLYKLRTMKSGTLTDATHRVPSDAVTRMGTFLRKTKLDELPQIINVLIGEMSWVGPRPCLFVQPALIEEREQRGIYTLKPGITGYAQVNGIDMSDDALLVSADTYYLQHRSLWLDIKILYRTLMSVGTGDKLTNN